MSQCQKVSGSLRHGATVTVVQALQVRVLCPFPCSAPPAPCCPLPSFLLPLCLPKPALPCPAVILGFVRAVVWMVSNIQGVFFPFQFCAWLHYHLGWHLKTKTECIENVLLIKLSSFDYSCGDIQSFTFVPGYLPTRQSSGRSDDTVM